MTGMSASIRRSSTKVATAKRAKRPITLLVRASQPSFSHVYDTYWQFAFERQEVYFRKLAGSPPPWTDDPILRSFRFTNAYRAADRVSQYLIRHVIYSAGRAYPPDDTLLRVLLFKVFNRIETWELLDQSVEGGVCWATYSFRDYDRVLAHAIEHGKRVYSAAYIMPACGALADGRKYRGHLRLIEKIVRDNVAERLAIAKTLNDVFCILRAYPTLGDFLALQYAIDLNYSTLMNRPESEFIVPGPGARDGIRKVFADPGGYNEADLVRYMADRQEREFDRLQLPFRTLWGRRLQLIDCQNLFCEVDKYARVRHPEVSGLSGRTRIKQRYECGGACPPPFFPPKWRLNSKIRRDDHVRKDKAFTGLFS